MSHGESQLIKAGRADGEDGIGAQCTLSREEQTWGVKSRGGGLYDREAGSSEEQALPMTLKG